MTKLDLNKYRVGGTGADEFGAVPFAAAPFVQAADDPAATLSEPSLTNSNIGVQTGPGHDLVQLAIQYTKLNPTDLSHMLERIRITKKIAELVPTLQKEAEDARQSILEELGVGSTTTPSRKKTTKPVD